LRSSPVCAFATETPDRTWINWFDAVLPRDSVWIAHMQAAIVLVAVAIGYVVYMLRSGSAPCPARQGSAARAVRPRAGQVERRDRPDVLDFLCHDVRAADQRRPLYFGFYSGYDVAMLHWVGPG
jgi:hypothetical protein